jgi:hypothetical protein
MADKLVATMGPDRGRFPKVGGHLECRVRGLQYRWQ